MQQLTKPELSTKNGELLVRVELTNQNVKNIHEALVFYLQSKSLKNNESTYLGIQDLREEVLTLHRLMNPS